PMQCGQNGSTCLDCSASNETCTSGMCDCKGSQCGVNQVCDSTNGCVCDPSSCNNGSGCVTIGTGNCGPAGGTCTGTCGITADNCSGGACKCGINAPCAGGQRCLGGLCVCDATSCGTGCCDGGGNCITAT